LGVRGETALFGVRNGLVSETMPVLSAWFSIEGPANGRLQAVSRIQSKIKNMRCIGTPFVIFKNNPLFKEWSS